MEVMLPLGVVATAGARFESILLRTLQATHEHKWSGNAYVLQIINVTLLKPEETKDTLICPVETKCVIFHPLLREAIPAIVTYVSYVRTKTTHVTPLDASFVRSGSTYRLDQ